MTTLGDGLQAAQATQRTRPNGAWVLLGTILASAMVSIDATALHVALPALQDELGASGSELLWIVNAYALFLAALILVGGSIGDQWGRRRVCVAGIIIFAAASLGCGVASSVDGLIVARAFQGVGGALMVPSSLAIVSSSFEPQLRGRAIGTWLGMTTVATVIGPVLGGLFASAGIWRGVFYINIPMAMIAVWVLYRRIPESRDEHASEGIDLVGSIVGTMGLAFLTYAFIEVPEHGFGGPIIPLFMVMGIGCLVLFPLIERRVPNPMVPMHLFRSRTFTGSNVLTFFLYGALSGALFFFPLNLIQVQNYPAVVAGFTLFPVVITMGTMSTWAGSLADRYGPRIPLVTGPLVVSLGFITLALPGITEGPSEYWTTYFLPLLFLGLGMAITSTPLTTAVMGSVSLRRAGVASGVNNAITRTAGVLAIAMMGAFMLVVFRWDLAFHLDLLEVDPAVSEVLIRKAGDLGNLRVPKEVDDVLAASIALAIRGAFVEAFQSLCYLSAGLSVVSAIFAYFTIEDEVVELDEAELGF